MARAESVHVAYRPLVPGPVRAEAQRLDDRHPALAWGPHSHVDFFELLLFEETGGRHVVRGTSEGVKAGLLVGLGPGVTHDLGELGTSSGWVLVFSAEAVGFAEGELPPLLPWGGDPLLAPFCRGDGFSRAVLDAEELAMWRGLMSRMVAEQASDGVGRDVALRALLQLVLVEAARKWPAPSGPPGSDAGALAEVFEVIERRYRDGLTLAEVADAVHVSPAHLTTTVRRTTGRTVGEWIIHRRIVEARRLLIETRLPIAEVAASVGYRDPVLFRRQFAARHAMAPGRWRAAASGRTKDRPSIPTDPH
jgi:AraC family transcriptional regulator, transcriptional activator of pobA